MSGELGTAVLTLTTDASQLTQGLAAAGNSVDTLDAPIKRATLSFRQMATAAAGIGAVVTGIAAGVAKLGERGAAVDDVRNSFRDLTAQIGQTSDVAIAQLRTATLGTVSNFELMKTVNLGLSQGLVLTSDQMGLAGDVAAVLADRVGGDTKTAFETLMQAMATGQDRTLKTIGLNIDATAATAAYAESIGKAVKDLTEQEKKEAIKNAILLEGQRVLKVSGKAQEDFGDKVAASQTKLMNFVDGVSVWVATSPSIGVWSSVITAASGTVSAMGLAIGPVSTGISKLIPMLGLSGGLSGAFASLGTIITTSVMPAFGAVFAALSPFLIPLAAVAAAIGVVYLAWKNWDTIGPILQDVYTAVKTWLVDKFVAIVEGVRLALETISGIWNTGRDVIVAVAEGVYTGVKTWLVDTFTVIVEGVRLALELVARTWTTAKDAVVLVAQSVYTGIKTWLVDNLAGVLLAAGGPLLAPVMAVVEIWKNWGQITTIAQNVYTGVKTWLIDKFQGIVDGIKGKIDMVTGFFSNMYDKVVGGSIVPDMIAGIREEFAKSDNVMVAPIERASKLVSDFYRIMKDEALTNVQKLVGGTLLALGELGKKFKAAAIASAIISTYLAAAKALAAGVWPFSLIQVTGALLAGWAQVNAIRSQDAGFKTGTQNLDFQEFGASSMRTLHGQEAIIPRGGGHQLAGEIAAALAPLLSSPQPATTQIEITGDAADFVKVITRELEGGRGLTGLRQVLRG